MTYHKKISSLTSLSHRCWYYNTNKPCSSNGLYTCRSKSESYFRFMFKNYGFKHTCNVTLTMTSDVKTV